MKEKQKTEKQKGKGNMGIWGVWMTPVNIVLRVMSTKITGDEYGTTDGVYAEYRWEYRNTGV